MATFDEFYESLPEDSNKRGEYFEKVFVPWFLKTDPEWSSQVKEVWFWDDYRHRWGKDCGIDLVYEDRQGNHWAIQSKCVSPDRERSRDTRSKKLKTTQGIIKNLFITAKEEDQYDTKNMQSY